MLLSVIIPTYNRAKILQECLQALLQQTVPLKDFEVIIVDDGSTDDTKKVVHDMKKDFAPHVRQAGSLNYIYQANKGQGIARNTALQEVKGNIVVLIGDDIIPEKNFLHEHLRYHLRYGQENEAVLGFTTWHPAIPVSPFMNWMTNGSTIFGKFGGHQFAYEKLKGKTEADYNFFYTSNISLKRALLQKYPFDPSFSGYGWEDIELGYRLTQREGLRLYYCPEAIGYHHHFMTEESLANRMRNIGKSAWIFQRKYPQLKKVPPLWKHFIFWILARPGLIQLFKMTNRDLYYYALSKKYFLEGLKEGRSEAAQFERSLGVKINRK